MSTAASFASSSAPSASPAEQVDRPGRGAVRTGWVLTVLVDLALLSDSITKIIKLPPVVAATVQSGFQEHHVRVIGILLLACLVVFTIPRTTLIGAVLVTAYLGGAVCTNLRLDLPLFGYVLSGVYVAIVLWLGLYLRSPGLRALVRAGS